MRESDILYQNGRFWVCRKVYGSGRLRPKSHGYAVFEDGLTYATLRAAIGYMGERGGLARAIAEADRRAGKEPA